MKKLSPPCPRDPLASALQQEQAEIAEAVPQLIASVMALETFVEDLLSLVAEVDPDRLVAMRDHAAGTFQRTKDAGADAPDAWLVGLYHDRWALLDAVLAKMGRPYTGAEVVDLDSVRRRSALYQVAEQGD